MKQLVSDFHALDIKHLARGGYLDPFSKYDWVWRTDKGTYETTVAITVVENVLHLVFPIGATRALQEIRLTHSTSPHGGKRSWSACPTCQRRVGVLYHASNLPFRCRTCCGLAYPSQYQSKNQSYGRQLRGISHRERDRLSGPCAVGA